MRIATCTPTHTIKRITRFSKVSRHKGSVVVSGATPIDTPDKEHYAMTVFTLIVVLVATTASALTMTLAYTMTKRIVVSETKRLRKLLHQTQLRLRHTQAKLESTEQVARHAVQARDYYKSLALPPAYSRRAKNAENEAEMKRRIREKILKARGR